jgi:hypothetical protein
VPRPPPPSRSLYVRQASEVPHPLPLQKPLNASVRFEHAHIRQLRSLAVCHAFSVWAGLHGSIIPNRATVMFEIAPIRICRLDESYACRFRIHSSDKFNICMRTCVRAHYAHIRVRVRAAPSVKKINIAKMAFSFIFQHDLKHFVTIFKCLKEN